MGSLLGAGRLKGRACSCCLISEIASSAASGSYLLQVSLIESTRFGQLKVEEEQLLFLPEGLIGIPDQHWVLISREPESPFIWLQSASTPDLALVVTQPEVFFPEYVLSLAEQQLSEIGLKDGDQVEVLAVVKAQGELPEWGINLAGPLVFDSASRRGAQLVNLSDSPVSAGLWDQRGLNQIEITRPQLPVINHLREAD